MRILVVDDDNGSRMSVVRFLKTMGHQVAQYSNPEEALAAITTGDFPIVFSDIKMPEMSGLDLLLEVSRLPLERQPKVVLFTGHGSMDSAIEALRMGAYDYLLKPLKAEALMSVINRIQNSANNINTRTNQVQTKMKHAACDENQLGICIFSQKMQYVKEQALKYHTERSIPVLIQGETGTGKELIARLVHNGAKRTDSPFIDINCAAIQPNLFESELFGYKAGAFTGGMGKDQKGKFDAARGGTIFLDEVAEMPLELQAKLLRVVQEREYYRVGGTEKISVDARIICATNVNLQKAVTEGRFRRDLYFRLQVGQIFLPSLRERPEDIVPLATTFMVDFSHQQGKRFTQISKEGQGALLKYDWPGNVRELKNVIERAVFIYDDEILRVEYLENICTLAEGVFSVQKPTDYSNDDESLIDKHTKLLVQDAIQKYRGNKAAAARYLGISRRALYRLLEKQLSDA